MPPGITIDALTGRVEEADDRPVLHCAWEVARHRYGGKASAFYH